MDEADAFGVRRIHLLQKALSLCAVLTFAATTISCGGSDGGDTGEMTQPSGSQSAVVGMVQSGGGVYGDPITYRFSPAGPTVSVGDTVVWTNGTTATHTVTADDGAWNSGDIRSSGRFRRVFTQSGTFRYYCTYHGAAGGVGMAGTITVEP